MGLQFGTQQLMGAARFLGTTGDSSVTPQYRYGGITATARSGVGVYTATLSPGNDIAETIVGLTVEGVAPGMFVQFNWASDLLINILGFTATATPGDPPAIHVAMTKVRTLG